MSSDSTSTAATIGEVVVAIVFMTPLIVIVIAVHVLVLRSHSGKTRSTRKKNSLN